MKIDDKTTFPAGIAGSPAVTFTPGVAPSSPSNGDMWVTATGWAFRFNGVTRDLSLMTVGGQASVADATGGAVIDVEARAALNDLLARCRTAGLIL